jgi:hypothetical protein
MATSITIETCYNKCTVEVPDDDMTFHGLIQELFIPASLGIGYQPGTIEEILERD